MKHEIRSLLLTAFVLSSVTRGQAETTPAPTPEKGVYASSSVEDWGWNRTRAVDGNRNCAEGANGWSSQVGMSSNHTEWIEIDLGSNHRINRVDLYPRNDAGVIGEGFPVDFTIQVSTSRSNWTPVVVRTGYAKPGNSVQSFKFEHANARFVRVHGTNLRRTEGSSDYVMQLAEVEIYNDAEATPASAPNLARGAKDQGGMPSFDRPAPVEVPIPTIRLSPRAQVVMDVNAPVLDLCGQWLCRENPPTNFAAASVAGTAGWTEIAIPRPSPKASGRYGYQRTFQIPDNWAGKRIKFRCDSAEGLAEVWVNGQVAGKHDGSWLQFELDITAAVQGGKDNTLSIQVTPSAMGGLAGDIQGGIRRKIYLMALPTTHLAGLQVETTFDAAYRDATLTLRPEVANESATPANLAVRWRLQDPSGKEVVLTTSEKSLPVLPAGQSSPIEVALPVPVPQQWHPEHPHLYTLIIELRREGKTVETVRQRVGFRQVEVKGDKLLVNGQPIKLRGAMLTYWHDSVGWGGLTDAQRRRLVGQWLDMNMNAAYPNPTPDEELLDLCDELGLAVICMARQTWTKATPANAPLFVQQAVDLIANHRHHPSVLLWTMGNESGWGPAFEAMAAAYRQLDPARPYMLPGSGTPPEHVPVDSSHYPGVQGKGGGGRPIIFTEYSHLNAYNKVEHTTDPGVRDYWHNELTVLWDSLYASERTAGAMIFCGTDCAGMPWGLVDGWHRPKPEFWHARKTYAPVRVVSREAPAPASGAPIRIEVENRYDVTNFKDLRIEWSAGGRSGPITADVPPRSKGTLEIPATTGVTAGDVALSFTNPQGRLVDTIRIAVGTEASKPAPSAKVIGKPLLKQTGTILTVNVGNIEWAFDAKTGLLTAGRMAGKDLVAGGPRLHIGETLEDWKPATVTPRETATNVEIVAEGAYGRARGAYAMSVDGSGALAVRYTFEHTGTKRITVREVGLAVDVARSCDTFTWERRAPWIDYPADHIGRAKGIAPAFRDPAGKADDPKMEPTWSWSLDQTPAGTADFRSTKYDIIGASLRSQDGAALWVSGTDTQAVRAAVTGNVIRLLVNVFSGSGSEGFLRASRQNRNIEPAGKIEGTATLRLVSDKP